MKHLFASIAACALLAAGQVSAQDFAVTNATLGLGDGSEPITGGTVVVRDGKIAAAGRGVAVPAGIPVIDGTGKWITPGLFLPVTDLGLYEIEDAYESNDRDGFESDFSASLDVAPAINADNEHIRVTRAAGVTRASAISFPSTSIFAGQGAVIDLGHDHDAVTQPRAFQLVYLGEQGAGLAGGSRSTAYVELDNALAEAIGYAAGRWDGDRAKLLRMDAKALGPVVEGEQKLYVWVERTADILAVLALREHYPKLDLVLVGAAEGWLVADRIAAAGVPVVAVGLEDLPESFEKLAATQSNVGRMIDAGVKVALGGFQGTYDFPRYAPHYAGNLVALNHVPGATGVTWGEALATITSAPAEISGMGSEAGVLAPGAHGDVVIWDGDPLEVSSAPERVFIDGIEQDLTSHQTRLRERYRSPSDVALPKAYEW